MVFSPFSWHFDKKHTFSSKKLGSTIAELKEKLFSEFAPVSTEEWMAKITADLKGVPFEKKLVWKTGEGFNVNPFYRAEDIEGLKTTESLPGEFPYVRGTKKDNDWKVRQNIEVWQSLSSFEHSCGTFYPLTVFFTFY